MAHGNNEMTQIIFEHIYSSWGIFYDQHDLLGNDRIMHSLAKFLIKIQIVDLIITSTL